LTKSQIREVLGSYPAGNCRKITGVALCQAAQRQGWTLGCCILLDATDKAEFWTVASKKIKKYLNQFAFQVKSCYFKLR